MLRITRTERTDDGIGLVLEGRLAGPWVAVLEAAAAAVSASSGPVRLNLAGVNFVDAAGLILLQRLRDGGAAIHQSSPFIQELLSTRRDSG